jgi:hypothetical protein
MSFMGWASQYIAKLLAGETVSFRPRGASMRGKIESGRLCTVVPVDHATIQVSDIVLCKVKGREYLHLVKAIQGTRFQIGNHRGHSNGWIFRSSIFGRCVNIEAQALSQLASDFSLPVVSRTDAIGFGKKIVA